MKTNNTTDGKTSKQVTSGTIIAILGLLLAICTADGSKGETGIRICGIIFIAVGAFLAGWTDKKKGAKQ